MSFISINFILQFTSCKLVHVTSTGKWFAAINFDERAYIYTHTFNHQTRVMWQEMLVCTMARFMQLNLQSFLALLLITIFHLNVSIFE